MPILDDKHPPVYKLRHNTIGLGIYKSIENKYKKIDIP